jgi:stage II sporulation protein D
MGLTPNPPGAERPEAAAVESGDKKSSDKELSGKKSSGKKSSGKKSPGKKPSGKKPAGGQPEEPPASASLPDRRVRTRDVDFAKAFEEGGKPRDTVRTPLPSSTPVVRSLRYPPYAVRKRPVRVALARNLKDVAVGSSASASAHTYQARLTFRGRVRFEADITEPGVVLTVINGVRRELRLPCTLAVSAGTGMLEYGGNSYRGAIVIAPEGNKTFAVINLIDVEEYLRGVVPLEIGNLKDPDIEAVKAQAVAARTYTYRKMAQSEGAVFDLLPTTSDQVYGGALAEAPTSDMALLLTKDLILAYENDIVHAYYHSTCGGRTANIEDVWGGEAYPYLKSLDDADNSGRAWCAGTTSYTWTETWSVSQFAGVLRKYGGEGGLVPPFSGSPRRVEARERFVCGRVKKLVIVSSSGEHTAGGDKIRFALRRAAAANQILRSANIRSAKIEGGEVVITGGGYGHGIGMCQVGAIARARAGQGFEEILKAYYSGVSIRTVVP